MECHIDDLPDVLLEYILSLIPPYKNLEECKLVSKRWFRATKNVIQHNEAHFRKSVAIGTLIWSSLTTSHWVTTIGKRYGHSACTYENSMYVFGGCTSVCTTFNDLWRLNLDTRTWKRPVTMGNYPSPKASATMLCYKKSFILFGGWSPPSLYPLHQEWKLFNDLHVYSIESNKWIAVNTFQTPPPLPGHSASIHKNYMVVFGGICKGDRCSDVWCLNLDTFFWHKQPTSNLKPERRYDQCQIGLGDNHLLVLGGRIGPDVPTDDSWLLNMEGPVWEWKKVNIRNPEWAPTRFDCHQACKVGNYVVVLGMNKRQAKSNDMNMAIKKAACQRTASARAYDTAPLHERQGNVPNIDRDVNVNGRHGSFPRASLQNNRPSVPHNPNFAKTLTLCNSNVLNMAAFRVESVRSATNSNRQLQLESLRRMEERIKNQRTQSKIVKRTENSLSIFVLDITNVLSEECSASWIPLRHNNQSGPSERIFYSLVAGRGELIVFGGFRKESMGMDQSEVYNDLYFINPPKYII